MSSKKEKKEIIGVIGGMGNEAMVDLARYMLESGVDKDKSYVFFGNSRLSYTPDELKNLKRKINQAQRRKYDTFRYTYAIMQALKVNKTGMSCNSGHTMMRDIAITFDTTFVDMIKETVKKAKEYTHTLILGTTSMISDQLYQKELPLTSATPSVEALVKLMDSVYHLKYGVKTGGVNETNYEIFKEALKEMISDNPKIDSMILGCTEIPLFFRYNDHQIYSDVPELSDISIINPTKVLAKSLSSVEGKKFIQQVRLLDHKRIDVDWFAPMMFRVDSIEEMIEIQDSINNQANVIVDDMDLMSGSYMHLPTLFLVNYDEPIGHHEGSLFHEAKHPKKYIKSADVPITRNIEDALKRGRTKKRGPGEFDD
jgi:aspartate/glutamate racemase